MGPYGQALQTTASDSSLAFISHYDNGWMTGYSHALDRSPIATPDRLRDCRRLGCELYGAADGLSYFHVRARDAAGNWGPAAHRAVRVDTTMPDTLCDAPSGWVNHDVTVHLDASDPDGGFGSSGVSNTGYYLDSVWHPTYDSLTGIPLTTEGLHTIMARSVDVANNAEWPMTVANFASTNTRPRCTRAEPTTTRPAPGGAPRTSK